MFNLIEKQAYKLKLLRKQKIYNVFYIPLLEQNITKNGQVDKNNMIELDASDNKSGNYKIKSIWDSIIYAKISKSEHLLGLYYLFLQKKYLEEKNT